MGLLGEVSFNSQGISLRCVTIPIGIGTVTSVEMIINVFMMYIMTEV